MASGYRLLWRRRDVRIPFAAALVGRLPMAMEGLAVILLVTGDTGSYSRAGFAVALLTTGAGLTAAVAGRAVDRFGRIPVLLAMVAIQAGATVMVTVVPARQPVFLALCAVVGAASPPLASSARSLWRDTTTGPERSAVYAADATLEELAYIAGPAIVGLLAATAGPRAALLTSAACALAGTVTFALCPLVRRAPVPRISAAPRSPRLLGRLLPVLIGGLGITAGLSIVELGVVGVVRDAGASAASGPLLAALSVGSIVGGVTFGARASRAGSTAVPFLLVASGAGCALLTAAGVLPLLGTLLLLAGALTSPTMAALSAALADLAPGERGTEAFGWLATAFTAGSTLGATAGGVAVGRLGAHPAFLVASVVLVLAAGGAAAGVRRGRDSAAVKG